MKSITSDEQSGSDGKLSYSNYDRDNAYSSCPSSRMKVQHLKLEHYSLLYNIIYLFIYSFIHSFIHSTIYNKSYWECR
jgi:hypothetical protein